ncbi:hypothetical protein M422DRAFT_250618 [Sphaerobolus stellatus SS14]|uniref:Protein kinase domain-containing protein n=1 Tax=Sphaerobolus stellatus (strain SS14) TaxID=990650 RepID=A0A0C9VFS4_SPHS4|nr:hypothetical protein M422DRAFT_250618 [Sphaerobolus stellatus SS14]
MDPSGMYPLGFHPTETVLAHDSGTRLAKHYTRRECPPKYYLIDLGLSRRYNPDNGIPAEMPIEGEDHTVPEFKGEGATRPANLYPTDLYYLGNFVKERFMMKFTNFEFMADLAKYMTQGDPFKRPTIDEVVNCFDGIIRSLSSVKLRSPLIEPGTHGFWEAFDYGIHFLFHELPDSMRGLPAIPDPGNFSSLCRILY